MQFFTDKLFIKKFSLSREESCSKPFVRASVNLLYESLIARIIIFCRSHP